MLISSRQRIALAAAVLGVLAAPVTAGAAPVTRNQARRVLRNRAPRPVPVTLNGVVASVDASAGTFVVTVSAANGRGSRALVGTNVTLSLAPGAALQVTGKRGRATLADVSAGDRVFLLATSTAGGPLVAQDVFDSGPPPAPRKPPVPPTAPAPPAPPTPPVPVTWSFTGTVTAVNAAGDTLSVNITQDTGASVNYSNTTQTFAVSSTTAFTVADNNGDGVDNLGDVSVGDTVTITLPAPVPVPSIGSVLTAATLSDSATTPIGSGSGSSSGSSSGSGGATTTPPAPD